MNRAQRLSALRRIRSDLAPAVAAIGVEGNASAAGEPLDLRVLASWIGGKGRELHGQRNSSRVRFDARAKDLVASPAATRVHDRETSYGGRHLAKESRRNQAVIPQENLGIAVKAARDFIVMELHGRVPTIHQLSEMRKRKALHLQQGSQTLAIVLSGDLDDDALDVHVVGGGAPVQEGDVLPSFMLQREARLPQVRVLEALGRLH